MDSDIGSLTIIFTEFYYWVTVVFMFLIHVGFCMYEVGASRRKNHLHTLMKNTMAIPLVTVTFFFFGWWIYFAFVNGPGIVDGGLLDEGGGAERWRLADGGLLGDRLLGEARRGHHCGERPCDGDELRPAAESGHCRSSWRALSADGRMLTAPLGPGIGQSAS